MSRWLGGVVLVCLWIFALYLIAIIWLVDTSVVAPNSKTLLQVVHDFMVNFGITMLITVLTLVVARALQKSLVGSLRRGHVNSNLVVLVGRTVFIATVVVGVILVLGVWGLGIALPVTIIGAMTVALTLALQDILKNVVSGVYLLVERPFVIGDQITIASYTGVVENIYIRVTALRTSGGERVLVPNGMLFSSPVVNNSFSQRRRVGLVVTVPDNGPDATAAAQQQVLLALEDVETALRTPAPEVALSKVSGGKVDLRAVFWLPVTRTEENGDTLSNAMSQVRTRLPEAEVAPLDSTLAD
jgi:small-conductance mechanosensitive channel